jgi:hypothetical protein
VKIECGGGSTVKAPKERRIGGITWSLVSLMTFAACLIGHTTQAQVETTRYKVSQYSVHLDSLRADDAEAHVLALFSRKGVAVLPGGEVVQYTSWGTADLIKGTGPVRGYTMLSHQDGSCALSTVSGTTEKGSLNLTGAFTRGTGRFEGIKGTIAISGKSLMPFNEERETLDNVHYEVTATYILPPK